MKKTKSKYSMFQSIAFMVRTAWKHQKLVLLLTVIGVVLNVALELLRLFVAPEILRQVEQAVPIPNLLGTIGLFCGLLFVVQAGKSYVSNIWIPATNVRCFLTNDISMKACMTALPNSHDPAMLKLQQASLEESGGTHHSLEHVWVTLKDLLINISCFLIYLLMLSDLNLILVATVIITTLLSFFVTIRNNKWEYRHKDELNGYNTQQYYIHKRIESIEFAKDIRIFGLKSWITDIRDKAMALVNGFVERRAKVFLVGNLIDLVLTAARNGVAYVLLIRLTLESGLSAPEFLLYFTAIGNFASRIDGVLKQVIAFHRECQGISQVIEYLNYPEPFRFEGGVPIPESDSYELRLDNVSFRYPGSEKQIFEKLDLTIRPGEKLAVVGLNGAGKTTLVFLLCGFYDPDEGRVLLNGMDIRQFNRREYYKLFSAVFQQFSILETNIRNNVTQTVEATDDKQVMTCLDKAGLKDFVMSLPEGLDTHVGREVYLDGMFLSGGQTQRLMLARALYKNGPILLLDEPTAALDPLAEHDIYMKYNEMTAGKTAIFISHRLASTRFCDRILFLSEGMIKEEGTHSQLLALGGEYANLFEVQSRYYQEGRDFREG